MTPPNETGRPSEGRPVVNEQGNLAGGLQGHLTTADGSREVSPEHQTCDLRELPPGAWMVNDATRLRLPLPACEHAAATLICLTLSGSVCPGDVLLRTDLQTFLAHIAWLQRAGYPVEIAGRTALWAWPTDTLGDTDVLMRYGIVGVMEPISFLIGKLREWARIRLIEGAGR